MDKQKAFSMEEYIDIVLRRKWLIIIPFILSLIITPCVYWKLPKIYRSNSSIMILPQKVPEKYVQSTITTSVAARLAIITEEVLSRTRLEEIINEFNLYAEARRKEPLDLIVEKAREDIEIEVKEDESHRRDPFKSGTFKVYYQGKNPETVRKVTNKIASLFIEENLKTREQQARVTTDFLDKGLESAKKQLEEQERAITEFKYKHMGNLPEQKAANLAMLRQLAEQRSMISERIARAEDKEILTQQQLSIINQFQDDGGEPPVKSQLEAAKNELLALKDTYTDNHIEVRKVQARIKRLEAELKSGEKEVQDETLEKSQDGDPTALDLKNKLTATQKEIDRLRKEEIHIKQQTAIYEKRIEEVPRIELQLAALTRDHANTKMFYEEQLRKKMEAEQAVNLERRQQGEHFRILDPASFPRIPYKPDPKKVFPIGIFLGLAAGLGLAFQIEALDKSFRNKKEVEEYLEVPVLAVIPRIKKKESSHLIIHSRQDLKMKQVN